MKKTVLGVLLGIGTLGFLVLYVGSERFKEALLQAELAWLAIGMALKVPVMWFKARRWAIAIEQAIGQSPSAGAVRRVGESECHSQTQSNGPDFGVIGTDCDPAV
jgi:hypothetical protein